MRQCLCLNTLRYADNDQQKYVINLMMTLMVLIVMFLDISIV